MKTPDQQQQRTQQAAAHSTETESVEGLALPAPSLQLVAQPVQRTIIQRDTDYGRILDMLMRMQQRINELEGRHPTGPIRVRLNREGYFDRITEIVQEVHRLQEGNQEIPGELTWEMLAINEALGEMERPQTAPRAPQRTARRGRERSRPSRERGQEGPSGIGQYPPYFGDASRDAMQRIEVQAEHWEWIGRLTIVATLITVGMNAADPQGAAETLVTGSEGVGSITEGGGFDFGTQAEAMAQMPGIAKRYIIDIATMTLVSERLNRQEQRFWRRLIQRLGGTV